MQDLWQTRRQEQHMQGRQRRLQKGKTLMTKEETTEEFLDRRERERKEKRPLAEKLLDAGLPWTVLVLFPMIFGLMGWLLFTVAQKQGARTDECALVCETRGSEMKQVTTVYGCLCEDGTVVKESN